MTELMKPGLYFDMPEEEYHGRPELSNSRAKFLVPPSTPLAFKHALTHERPNKKSFDIGHAVHSKVLGAGAEVVAVQKLNRQKEPVDAEDYTTVSAQAHRDAIYAEGKVPLLAHEIVAVNAMAESILKNPDARFLMEMPSRPEVSAFWECTLTGVACRARFDWLPDVVDGRRLIIGDVKTGVSAWPREFIRSGASYLYDMQDAWYRDAARTLGLDPEPELLFVVVEKTAPYDVAVIRLDHGARIRGQALMERTRQVYAECLATDTWPGIPHGVHTTDLPIYEHYRFEEFLT